MNTLSIDANLIDAVEVIESTFKRLAVVVSKNDDVIGTLTDGDIRRALLDGNTLEMPVVHAMNKRPIMANADEPCDFLIKLLNQHNIRSLPLIDPNGKYVRVVHLSELLNEMDKVFEGSTFTAAVIMAGGEGTRLRPLTERVPKPMVDINGLPLLERQIHKLKKAGIFKIFISVNYLKESIIKYFGDGSEFGVKIHYLHEEKKMGTAGALALMPDIQDCGPLIVMNGDVLTTSDFVNLFHFHIEHKATITISTVDYQIQVPYGVISCEGAVVKELIEKPSQHFFCNAGIYALSRNAIKRVPKDSFYNMTDLIEECLQQSLSVTVFPMHEYWADIGTPGDLAKARSEFLSNKKYV